MRTINTMCQEWDISEFKRDTQEGQEQWYTNAIHHHMGNYMDIYQAGRSVTPLLETGRSATHVWEDLPCNTFPGYSPSSPYQFLIHISSR